MSYLRSKLTLMFIRMAMKTTELGSTYDSLVEAGNYEFRYRKYLND